LDHSSVTSSPRLIAGSYVLHRLLVPRHPPCALTNLATKMLASTVQFSSYGRRPPSTRRLPTHPAQPRRARQAGERFTERAIPHEQAPHPGEPSRRRTSRSPIPQDPTACQAPTHPPGPFPPHPPTGGARAVLGPARAPTPTNRCSTLEHPPRNTRPGQGPGRHPQEGAGARRSLERR
jgi:hypothetical protein